MALKPSNPQVETKSLPEVFKELQAIREKQEQKNKKIVKVRNTKRRLFNKWNKMKTNRVAMRKMIASTLGLFVLLTILISNTIFASNKEEKHTTNVTEFEENKESLNIEQIRDNNISIVKYKEKVTEDRNILYDTLYQENDKLPKGEQVVVQKGEFGKQKVTVLKKYENDQLLQETVTDIKVLQDPIQEKIEVGTSEFLAKHKVHIEDTMYLLENTIMREEPKVDGKEIATISKYLDIQLKDVIGDWAKVIWEGKEGYVECKTLTSFTTTPNVIEKNRIQKILTKVDINMELNKPSGLTLKDFKQILCNDAKDKNKVIETNVQVFYEVEQRYQINGIFLAAMAIHESGWGTSAIANDKKNLFGYGAYDSDAYTYAYTFEEYSDGIDLVARVLTKYYLNVAGTKIYDGEIASAKYYNGPTVSGVNQRYASDPNWGEKVFSTMQYLYGKLQKEL